MKALLVAALALAVRIYTAGWGGLSCDEAICANIAESTWSQMFMHIKLDGNAPLLYTLIKLWTTVFSTSDLSLRVFALASAAVLPPCAYLMFRRDIGENLAFQFAILLALCAPLVEFGNLVRPYGLLPLLALFSTRELMRLLDSPGRKIHTILYALSIAIAVYLHHWGAVLAIGHTFLIACGLLAGWWSKSQLRSFLKAACLALALYIPWLAVIGFQLVHDVTPWILPPSLDEFLFLTPVEAVSGYREKPEWWHWVVVAWANLAFWMSLLLQSDIKTPDHRTTFACRRWQLVVAGGLTTAFLVSIVRSIWRDRYLTTFSPILLLLYVVVGSRFTRKLPGALSFALPILLWLPIWLPQMAFFHSFPESSAWALMEQIGRETDRANDIVVVSFEAIAPQVDRYLPDEIKVISYPDLERVSVVSWAGIDGRIREQWRLDRLLSTMQNTLDKGGRVWLVESYHKYEPFPLRYPINDLGFNSVEAVRMCQIRAWLEGRAVKTVKDLWAPGREFSVTASSFKQKPGSGDKSTEPVE